MRTTRITPWLAAGLVLTLSSCGLNPSSSDSDPKPSSSQPASPSPIAEPGVSPTTCDLEEIIAAFGERLEGAEYIPTEWQPAEGTDLFEVYEAGGIACTYGIESAEIGGTVMWAPATDEVWQAKSEQYKSEGYIEVDIPDVNEHEALVLESPGVDGQAVWYINFHVDGVWIQFGASKFITSLEDALGIIQASALVTEAK